MPWQTLIKVGVEARRKYNVVAKARQNAQLEKRDEAIRKLIEDIDKNQMLLSLLFENFSRQALAIGDRLNSICSEGLPNLLSSMFLQWRNCARPLSSPPCRRTKVCCGPSTRRIFGKGPRREFRHGLGL